MSVRASRRLRHHKSLNNSMDYLNFTSEVAMNVSPSTPAIEKPKKSKKKIRKTQDLMFLQKPDESIIDREEKENKKNKTSRRKKFSEKIVEPPLSSTDDESYRFRTRSARKEVENVLSNITNSTTLESTENENIEVNNVRRKKNRKIKKNPINNENTTDEEDKSTKLRSSKFDESDFNLGCSPLSTELPEKAFNKEDDDVQHLNSTFEFDKNKSDLLKGETLNLRSKSVLFCIGMQNESSVKKERGKSFSARKSILKKNSSNVEYTKNFTPKLDRSSTFLKESPLSNIQSSNVTNRKNNSTLNTTFDQNLNPSRKDDTFNTTFEKILEVSKQNIDINNETLDLDTPENLTLSRTSNVKVKINASVSASTPLFKSTLRPSGTPYPKASALKSKDKKNVSFKEKRTSIPKDKVPKRTKIPNFALIHQRAYEKLENIKELSQRKAERAKLLLSGSKPMNSNQKKFSPKPKEDKTSKKQLNFVSKQLSPKQLKVEKMLSKTSERFIKTTPKEIGNKGISIKSNIPKAKQNKVDMKSKEGSLKPTRIVKPTIVEKNVTKYGYKVDKITNVTKAEQLKAFVNKSKIQRNSIEKRRNLLTGVRSNRRFELLMSMRKGKS